MNELVGVNGGAGQAFNSAFGVREKQICHHLLSLERYKEGGHGKKDSVVIYTLQLP